MVKITTKGKAIILVISIVLLILAFLQLLQPIVVTGALVGLAFSAITLLWRSSRVRLLINKALQKIDRRWNRWT
ncbi:hypothetical protein AKJ51_01065 [candidate division MSBL1 archaeon SCGC-AAA382A20]|uniref:Uncharacterized protein n=1 Tax=candidate division MSBL1 archaeon SCGC-AAA382A20 TaxID=1698280 RepID=A0A133VMD5_9EURY|nr:hypothetical protein AKJ51_01065 [candidate division MSBL1 archaeon SCGC-AAA382A20]